MCGPIFEVSAGISTVEKVAERQDSGLWEHQGAEVSSMACLCLVWVEGMACMADTGDKAGEVGMG